MVQPLIGPQTPLIRAVGFNQSWEKRKRWEEEETESVQNHERGDAFRWKQLGVKAEERRRRLEVLEVGIRLFLPPDVSALLAELPEFKGKNTAGRRHLGFPSSLRVWSEVGAAEEGPDVWRRRQSLCANRLLSSSTVILAPSEDAMTEASMIQRNSCGSGRHHFIR